MRRAVLSTLLLVAACQKASPPDNAGAAAQKIDPPDDVLATVALAHPAAFATRAGRYADQVSPGAGAQLDGKMLARGLAAAIGAASLEGLDLEQPVWLVFFDPKTHPRPFVLAGSFADADKLRRDAGAALKVERDGGRALVGPEAEVAAVKTWALQTMVKQPAADAPTAEIWLGRVIARYGADLKAFPKQMAAVPGMGAMQGVLQAEVDGVVALGSQSERLLVVVDAGDGTASMELTLVGKPGTSLAKFVAAQKPVDPALASKLPSIDGAVMLMAGHMELRPFLDGIYSFFGPMLADWTGRTPDAAFRKLFDDWFQRFDGDFAAVARMSMGGPSEMIETIGVDDGPAAQRAMAALFDKPRSASFMGMKMTMTPTVGAEKHGDASIDSYAMAMDLAALAPMQQEMQKRMYPPDGTVRMAVAGWGKTLGIAISPSSTASLGAAMDAMQGGATTGKLPAYAQAVFDAAAKRKDSAVMTMNMAAMFAKGAPAKSGLAMTFGFAKDRARMRVEMPAAHIVELVGAMQGLRGAQ